MATVAEFRRQFVIGDLQCFADHPDNIFQATFVLGTIKISCGQCLRSPDCRNVAFPLPHHISEAISKLHATQVVKRKLGVERVRKLSISQHSFQNGDPFNAFTTLIRTYGEAGCLAHLGCAHVGGAGRPY